MAKHTITPGLKRFVRLNLSVDRCNTQFGFQVVLLLLLTASWNATTVHAKASTPDADTVYLKFHYKTLDEMEQEFYNQNKAAFKKLRWDRRKGIFLVVDQTHDAYFGKKRHRWLHAYRSEKGSTGSFEFLTFALVAPGQWRRVIRCIPVPSKTDVTSMLTETAKEIYGKIHYKALLLDRGFYDKKYAFALQKESIPFIIRAELRGKILLKLQRIIHCRKTLHWHQTGFDPLILWLGWKKYGNKKAEYGFLTNSNDMTWTKGVHWYKQRWNIENVFKATDGIQFQTATAKIKARLFAVLLSFLLYNAWQEEKVHGAPCSLALFLEEMINGMYATYHKHGPPIKLHVPGWNVQVIG